MKAASVVDIRKELKFRSPEEMKQLVLRLARFKKENKELLTYLLFEAHNEEGYVETVKQYIDDSFSEINRKNFYWIKKSVRKTLRETKKFIRYSSKKETEVELLIYFCQKLKDFKPNIKHNRTLMNLYERQLKLIESKTEKLHDDLQFDFKEDIELLNFG